MFFLKDVPLQNISVTKGYVEKSLTPLQHIVVTGWVKSYIYIPDEGKGIQGDSIF